MMRHRVGSSRPSPDRGRSAPSGETGPAQEELVLDEIDSEDEEESPERFIPTEEISQDFGVSFPVDI